MIIYNEKYADLSEEEAERKVKDDRWEWEDIGVGLIPVLHKYNNNSLDKKVYDDHFRFMFHFVFYIYAVPWVN
ncbi:hypothetical protein MUN88_04675 [Gracilibacillus caseinilyticus]|uniref:Uncharacterized protein n=1 Tax=Gracilibacillus caseinilyticus TaxID=2932256 RepID=A0ABY4EYC1_9BACI|nr:hypothetical protein [Gracilibacillus caseinilyticus]UOQ49404.1 hypothetical protein MUN88_04675 [Gracilibacillus caseinilyticus]